MLMYGNSYCVGMLEDIPNTKIYNISTMREGFNNLQILIPPPNIGYTFDREFDVAYYYWVMNNDEIFVEFFRIIQDLANGRNVYLMISDTDEWSINLIQSLLKIIQQTYGYNAYYITPDTDILSTVLSDDTGFNKEWGLYNLDQHMTRYASIVKMRQNRVDQKSQYAIEQHYI